MRTLGAAAVLSVVVHAAAFAWWVTRPPEVGTEVGSAVAPPALPRPPAADAEPMVVELLAASTSGAREPLARRTERAPTIATSTPLPAKLPPAGPPGGSTGESTSVPIGQPSGVPVVRDPDAAPHHLTMRSGPEIPRLVDQLVDAAIAHPGPSALPDLPGERARFALQNAREHGDWAAVVALTDELHAQELVEHEDGTYHADHLAYDATVARDGTVAFHDKPNLQVHGLSGTFDATDWMLRSHGEDPYAHGKLAFLDRTRDQRVEIGKVYRREQLSHAVELMQANLERMWATTRDPAQRKQLLFELWDECAETGDGDLVDAASDARAFLLRFAEVKLREPYTADELARLNAHRHSKARFEPGR